MSNSSTDERREEAPRKRVPMGGRRQKLQLSDEDLKRFHENGWTPRFINNQDGRIQEAQSGGYVFVRPEEAQSIGQFSLTKGSNDLDSRVSMIVSKGDGEPITAFLMKIQTKYYNEDKLAKEQKNIAYDESLSRDQPGGNVVENQYVPKGHVNKV